MYSGAVATAASFEIAPKVFIRVITPPYFLVTKLEAFADRGENDFLGSSDLEDIISVVNGREGLIFEVENAQHDVRAYIAAAISDLLSKRTFIDALPGHLNPDELRINIVVDRLQQLARL